MKLNLGAGEDIREGFVNVDIKKTKGINVVWNLNKYPYPFKTSSISYILASHVIEHLDNPKKFLLELHRISKPNAVINIYTPHFSHFTSYADLQHKHHLSLFFLGHPDINSELYNLFKVKRYLNFNRMNHRWMNLFFNPLVNVSHVIYERFLCYLLPSSEINFKLKVKK